MKLVIGVGFIFTDDITALAKEYPNTAFAGVDFAVTIGADGKPEQPPPNVAALKLREEQGSFLVGAIAALVGHSKKVGFIGGMDSPLIHKFEAGYRAGVKQVCPDCEVLVQYAGVTPDAFRNPGRGKELALSQYQQGVNVIYHASGSTGLGVFEAARTMNRLAIGVDADQYREAPGHVLTSMVKRVDNAVYDAILRVKENRFKGGIYDFGLAEDGVGYVYDDHNRALIPDKRARACRGAEGRNHRGTHHRAVEQMNDAAPAIRLTAIEKHFGAVQCQHSRRIGCWCATRRFTRWPGKTAPENPRS